MDEKAQTSVMESGAHKSKLVGVSMLLLSLLLTVAVASLIYVAISNTGSQCQGTKQESTEVDVKATVQVKSEDDKIQDEEERIEYSRGGHQIFTYSSTGSFNFDDLGKGIHVMKRKPNGICYIIPVGGNQTVDDDIEGFLHESNGAELAFEDAEIEFTPKIYDGKLTDVSFLPQKVQDECTSGYQWMVIIAPQDLSNGSELGRTKREIDSDNSLELDETGAYWHFTSHYCRCGVDLYCLFAIQYHHSNDCEYPKHCRFLYVNYFCPDEDDD